MHYFKRGAVLAALLLAGTAQAGDGKLLLTGGVSSIDGAAGGGLTPWALTAGYASQGEWGLTAFGTRSNVRDYDLTVAGVAASWSELVELSYARQSFDAGVVVPGATLKQDIIGIKLRVAGDAVLDSDRWLPQVAVGAQFKRLDPGADVGAVLESVGAKDSGTDLYLSATKLFLAQGVLLNATLRATKANQNGLLGFGSLERDRYTLRPELSLAWLARRDLAFGAELRTKPDQLAFAGAAFAEDDWWDLFVAWTPSKHVSLTLAYVDLGHIVGKPRQTGGYASLQLAY